MTDLPEGLECDGDDLWWSTCPACGHQQADMGNGVECEECDKGPMPTLPRDYSVEEEQT